MSSDIGLGAHSGVKLKLRDRVLDMLFVTLEVGLAQLFRQLFESPDSRQRWTRLSSTSADLCGLPFVGRPLVVSSSGSRLCVGHFSADLSSTSLVVDWAQNTN